MTTTTQPANGIPAWVYRFSREKPLLRSRGYEVAKRIMDLAIVLLGLPLLLPVFGLCAAAIKLEHPQAAVLYTRPRTGRGGHMFPMLKFRSMVPNAEALKEKYAHLNELEWPDFKIQNDPRVTRVGRILRKASLDELPQVLNVLKGEMSLVGPRPTDFGSDDYQLWHTQRFDVLPGITGLWQITGRGETEFDDRLRLDITYVKRRSLLLDLLILVHTLPAVLNARGAY